MTHGSPAETARRPSLRNELGLRIASAALLIPLALAVTYLGGWIFTLFWAAAALWTFFEWMAIVAPEDRMSLIGGAISLAIAVGLLQERYVAAALIMLAITAAVLATFSGSKNRIWALAGLFYAAAVAGPVIVLRSDEKVGFLAVLFLFAIVWGTDIAAYFTGRAVGGPKLAPRVSPGKTWSGAFGGLLAASIAAGAFVKAASLPAPSSVIMIALLLSLCAQGGDLFESWLKRRFGRKNSGSLIPGHGGVMDRLDAFVMAALVAAFIGVLRGGMQAPGRGLLMW